MTAPLNNAKLALLVPAVLNPATAAAVGVGLLGVGLLWLLRDDKEDATVDAVPLNGPETTLLTVVETLPAVETLPDVEGPETDGVVPATISEADQKEMIRNAMSALGKRSAAARAKKKAEREENGELSLGQ